jgi:hypothetical protein
VPKPQKEGAAARGQCTGWPTQTQLRDKLLRGSGCPAAVGVRKPRDQARLGQVQGGAEQDTCTGSPENFGSCCCTLRHRLLDSGDSTPHGDEQIRGRGAGVHAQLAGHADGLVTRGLKFEENGHDAAGPCGQHGRRVLLSSSNESCGLSRRSPQLRDVGLGGLNCGYELLAHGSHL